MIGPLISHRAERGRGEPSRVQSHGVKGAVALFPVIVKRGLPKMQNPIFHKSVDDVNLLFEVNPAVRPTLRSRRRRAAAEGRRAGLPEEDADAGELTDIRRLISGLLGHVGRLRQGDFERTLLTMVYTAQHVIASTTDHQREAWAESFVGLYKAIKEDLIEAW
ncbi:Protein FAM180A [Merluccius polli]|uniref:Protein FAM180A n=1 Tax=Merluccius polli TaxID=89951 RepID=A0AA47M3Q8_MERPO|nr:Protein FAM180A [Merluccius polli]